MPEPLTWNVILALDDAALNTAIDTQIYGYVWEHTLKPAQEGWCGEWWYCTERPGGPVTYSSAPYFPHTASWERTMALCLAYAVTVQPLGGYVTAAQAQQSGQLRTWFAHTGEPFYQELVASPDDPQALRVALCRLALWHKICEQESLEPPCQAY